MKTLPEATQLSFQEDVYKCILSNPVQRDSPYQKAELNQLDGRYQLAQYTKTQVFHKTLTYQEAKGYIEDALGLQFRSLNAWSSTVEYSIRISKKGKVLYTKNTIDAQQSPKKMLAHNREKNISWHRERISNPS